ncbi:MAG TPA: hypothetical protein VLK85_19995 [Ramlibacter sp.]|nr:hypothetical protein [Ramlibacter sp.]
MTLALLIAALAASGGLQSRDAIESHMREAVKTPERDFRSLIDMARGAVDQVVNAGKLPGERRYVSIDAMYSDRIVIELDGKHWQYSYTLKPVNGVEQMVLSDAVQVVGQFVPVSTAVKEAVVETVLAGGVAVFREAEDGSIEVTLVKAGASKNGNYYPESVLKEAAPMFEGVRVFAKGDKEHLAGDGKSVRNLIGGIYGVRFVEAAGAEAARLVGTFKALDPTDGAVVKMAGAVKRSMQNLLGLSIDAHARTKQRLEGGKRLREATKFTKVNSVDLIVEPGAGGGLDRLTEAAAETHQGESTMPLWKQRMLEAIKAKDATKHAAIDPATITDEAVMQLFEAVYPGVNSARAALTLADTGLAGLPAQRLVEALADAGTQRVTEAAGDNTPVTRAELQMIELRQTARTKIAGSKLPQAAKDKLTAQFGSTARFVEADVDKAITDEGAYLARFTESGAVRVPMFGGAGSIEVGDRSVAMKDMLDAFFDPKHKNHRDVHSFKECYIEITGDRKITGELKNCDMSRLAEAMGEGFREAIASTTFADALGDSITRRMQAVYTGMVKLDTWRKACVTTSVNDFRTQERIRIGGYGNLPAVNEGADYVALTSPGDDKATYAATKRGGTETVTLETILNDDVQAIRRIPVELALAAKNTLYEFVWDFYRTNPNIHDGAALYTVGRGNLFTVALSAAEFAIHRLAMLKQTRAGSAKRQATPPAILAVPFELEETAFNLFVRNQNLDPNFVGTLNPEIIPVSYWTDATDWVTLCDQVVLPILEIGFLQGKEDPELFVQDMPNVGSMFNADKLTYKIRHVYGGGILVDGEKGTTKAVVA